MHHPIDVKLSNNIQYNFIKMVQLEKSDYANLEEELRIKNLNLESEDTHPKFTYIKPLTEDDIKIKNEDLNQAIQRIKEFNEERKEIGKKIKEQNLIIYSNNEQVINKGLKITEMVWEVNNFDRGVVEYINSEGLIVDEKKLQSTTQRNLFKDNRLKNEQNNEDSKEAV